MAIAVTDLIFYASLNRPLDDVTLTGGAIDPDHRVIFTQLAANDEVEAVSSNAADTSQVITVVGRKADGTLVTTTATLNGTSAVILAPTTIYAALESAVLGSDAAGTVTVRRKTAGPTLSTIPPGERGFHIMFKRSISEASPAVRNEKFCCKNVHATLALNTAKIKLSADPSAKIKIGLQAAKNDSTTAANRKTAATGITFSDDGVELAIPGDVLEAGSYISVWAQQSLGIADAPFRSTFTVDCYGDSA